MNVLFWFGSVTVVFLRPGSSLKVLVNRFTRGRFSHSLVGSEDFVCDLTEEDLFVRPQIRRRFLPGEGFSVEKRHLGVPRHPPTVYWKREGSRVTINETKNRINSEPIEMEPELRRIELEQRQSGGTGLLFYSAVICPHGGNSLSRLCSAKPPLPLPHGFSKIPQNRNPD